MWSCGLEFPDALSFFHLADCVMMEKLVEVSDQVVCIDFVLGTKCRATVRLRSLSATTPIAFKVQTSSPHKFLVNPPSGLIPPLSQSTFQIILRPQPQIPSDFPRSPSDRFLIRTSRAGSAVDINTITSWTYDVKLKVAFVGPFLLRHAVNNGDCDAVRSMVKFQRTILTELSIREAESVHRVATRLDNSVEMVGLLLEAGLKVESTPRSLEEVEESRWAEKGWSELHAAVAFDRTDEVSRLIKMGKRETLDCKDREGRTPFYLAASKGFERSVKMLAGAGANVDAKRNDGWTALYRAAAKGDRRMVKVLIELGADPSITADNRNPSAIDIARDEGHKEIVEILERGEEVLNAARRGDLMHLEFLLERDASVDFRDQYGLTAIHMAAIKGHKDVVMLLVEFGSDIECTEAEGRTPLHMAAVGGSKDTVEVLINRGANVNAKCNRGATPLQVAQTMGYEIITQFLLLQQPTS
ncbi:ankyrin repeat domain-containing protein 50-like [Cynara cardunculus var. scolymus]|uniref:Ankyrin repeat-containing protein n=1 Tax=Cynara cardunculus var. scolymus TaxID=59895 RepID=A0A103YIY1_CYNCS|nr:ankyrin repeat domain-containing protein 50-like [Cynara cardunculus var. scolymus]KVI09959.1 Ankyrin repeat-containing protein [Cynara cardunculus var. scolymus]